MKTNVQETSREAYKEIRPELGARQRLVFEYVRSKGMALTNTEIAAGLKLPINQVTGRSNELAKMGYFTFGIKRPCTITGKKCIAWKVVIEVPKFEQENLF